MFQRQTITAPSELTVSLKDILVAALKIRCSNNSYASHFIQELNAIEKNQGNIFNTNQVIANLIQKARLPLDVKIILFVNLAHAMGIQHIKERITSFGEDDFIQYMNQVLNKCNHLVEGNNLEVLGCDGSEYYMKPF